MVAKFTVIDTLVKDSLGSVSLYQGRAPNYKPVVSGGIATQMYCYPEFSKLVRPTHDLDLLVTPRLSPDVFRGDLGLRIASILSQYDPEVNILRHVYEVKLHDGEGDHFFVHTYKWTVNGWERSKRKIERAVSNASKLTIPNSAGKVDVVRAEDIVADKTDRLIKLREAGKIPPTLNGDYWAVRQRDWGSLGGDDLGEWLPSLTKQKERLPSFFDRGQDEFRAALDEYVASKDLFDISLIAKLVAYGKIEFNEVYYDRILSGAE